MVTAFRAYDGAVDSAWVTVVEIASVSPTQATIPIGNSITFTAVTYPIGYEYKVSWSAGYEGDSGTGESFTVTFTKAGTHTITARCGISVKTATITVVEVSSVTANNDIIPVGDSVTFTATTYPSGHGEMVNWSGGGTPSNKTGSGTFTTTYSTPGIKTVTASCGSSRRSKSIIVFKVEVSELSFANDHDIYNISDPVWTNGGVNDPACYTKNSNLVMTVKLVITPPISSATISLRADGPGSLDAQKDSISISGSVTTVSGITTTGKLEDKIYSTTPTFNWSFSTNGTNWSSAGTSGPHKLYAIYDSPKCGDSDFTDSNIDGAIGKATGENTDTEDRIASKANDNVGDNVYEGCICGDGFQKNFDAAMGNYPASGNKGMCCCRAEGLDCVLNVLGIGPYTHDYVNEHDEPNTNKLVYISHCNICNKDVIRNYWDGFWNNWEGVVKAGGVGSTCYAPANGSISIDEGTYSQIDSAIATDCGYYWQWGPNFGNICPHLSAP